MIVKRSLSTIDVLEATPEVVKLHILARTTAPINNGEGLEYEDLQGGIYPESVALDLEHVGTDPIGKAFNFVVTDAGLECDAEVYANLPSTDRPISNEILAQLQKDIPLDASILFTVDTPDAVEQLTSTQTAVVNGCVVNGPCTIYRVWRLRSLTLCRVGADPNTQVTVRRSFKEITAMDEEKPIEEQALEEVQEEEATQEQADLDALLVLVAELQDKLNEVEARVVALETPEAEEEPAPIEEEAEEPQEDPKELEALKANVTMLRHQMVAFMRSNSGVKPVGIVEETEEPHDALAASIRYSMQGLNID